ARAKEIFEGAEVLDLTEGDGAPRENPAAPPPEDGAPLGPASEADAAFTGGERPAGPAPSKSPTWGILKTELVSSPRSLPHGISRPVEAGDAPLSASPPARPRPLVEHTAELSTVDRPPVPAEERDRPNDAGTVREVLSRDGCFCRVPGC